MGQGTHFSFPKRKLSVLVFRSIAFLFAPGELSSGGHGAQLRFVTSWLVINFLLASLCWPLTGVMLHHPGRVSRSDLPDLCEGVLLEVKTLVVPR